MGERSSWGLGSTLPPLLATIVIACGSGSQESACPQRYPTQTADFRNMEAAAWLAANALNVHKPRGMKFAKLETGNVIINLPPQEWPSEKQAKCALLDELTRVAREATPSISIAFPMEVSFGERNRFAVTVHEKDYDYWEILR